MRQIAWPDGYRFAFTIFDDPDSQSMDVSREMYALLHDLGLRTTKAIWVLEPAERNSPGDTCQTPGFVDHCRALQERGFELAYHNGAPGTLTRADIVRSLDLFRAYFGHDPASMANHYNADAIYWRSARLDGIAQWVYAAAMRESSCSYGHVEAHPCFWGDICRERIRYCRNFVFRTLNTLLACPYMPYADHDRQYVRSWYAASEGANRRSFLERMAEPHQDRLEEEGGACILYTHLGHGFVQDGRIDTDVRRLLARLASRRGWFVPVTTMLDYLAEVRGVHALTPRERGHLQWSWLTGKLLHGTS
jgi:hypothetical protein